MNPLKTMQVSFDPQSKLFTIPCGKGYSCLGLEVLHRRASRLAAELGEPWAADAAPLAAYAAYERLVSAACQRNAATGWRSASELTPELLGLEGHRVEVRHCWPSGAVEVCRFQVGKSLGFIPCHLALARRDSSGGPAVCLGEILSVRRV